MDRRRFAHLLGAAAAYAALPQQIVHAQASGDALKWVKLVDEILGHYDNATESLDWFFWMQDAQLAVATNRMPPPPPVAWGVFSQMVEEEQEKVRALEIPAYETTLPSTVPPLSGSLEATRGEMRSRAMMLEDCHFEFTSSVEAVKYLEGLHAALGRQAERFRMLGDLLAEWSQLPLGPFLMQQLALESISTIYYVDTVNETAGIVRRKLDTAEAGLAQRRVALGSRAREIVNLLIVEAIDLKVEAERLRLLDQEVIELGDRVRIALEDRAAALQQVRDQEVYVEAARMDLTQAEDALEDSRQERGRLNTRRQTLSNALGEQFRCPNGKPWEDCDHWDLKQQYTDRQQQRRNDLASVDRRLAELGQQIPAQEADVRDATRNVGRARDRLAELRSDLQEAEERHREAVRVFNERDEFARQEKMKSRADLFLQENDADTARVNALLSAMGG